MKKMIYFILLIISASCEEPEPLSVNVDLIFDIKLSNSSGDNYLMDGTINIDDISFVFDVNGEIKNASTPSFVFDSSRYVLVMHPSFINNSGKYISYLSTGSFPQDTLMYEIFTTTNSKRIDKVWVNDNLKWDRKIDGDNDRPIVILKE